MALTISQANAVNALVKHLTGSKNFTREQAIEALAELVRGASKALLAGYTPDNARIALRQRWHDVAATTWTEPYGDGREYDLTVGYHDDGGDAWTCVGWLTPFDGVPVPYMECRGLATDIETVIRQFGPLTADTEDGAQ